MSKKHMLAAACLAAALAGMAPAAQAQLNSQELKDIGIEAYLYLYPLVFMDLSRRQATNVDSAERPGFAPLNTFQHARCIGDTVAREPFRPSLDTLRSTAWLDVGREPVILSLPEGGARYYYFALATPWSETFAALGSRTLGGTSAHIALITPGWKGTLPKGVERLEVPAQHVYLNGQTLVKGSEDCAAANAFQDTYRLTPLSQWQKPQSTNAKPAKFKADPKIDMATPVVEQIQTMPATAYFKLAFELLQSSKPNQTDGTMLYRLKKIGFDSGKRVDISKLDGSVQMALNEAAGPANQAMQWRTATPARKSNGWAMPAETLGAYGNGYLRRAATVREEPAASPLEDAFVATLETDADGYALTGDNETKYLLRFKKSEFPPAGYWTITLYDANGQPFANRLNRFQVNTATPLQADRDGTVDVLIQHNTPGSSVESNWLPAPKGPFSLVMRTYLPQAVIHDGQWMPPPVERVKSRMGFGD